MQDERRCQPDDSRSLQHEMRFLRVKTAPCVYHRFLVLGDVIPYADADARCKEDKQLTTEKGFHS